MRRKSKYKKPERPKPRALFQSNRPSWVILEPARLAPVGGSLFAFVTLLYYLARDWFGTAIAGMDIVVGVAFTFVVGYAATGVFVYWLLWVAARELPEEVAAPPPSAGARETAAPESEIESGETPGETTDRTSGT